MTFSASLEAFLRATDDEAILSSFSSLFADFLVDHDPAAARAIDDLIPERHLHMLEAALTVRHESIIGTTKRVSSRIRALWEDLERGPWHLTLPVAYGLFGDTALTSHDFLRNLRARQREEETWDTVIYDIEEAAHTRRAKASAAQKTNRNKRSIPLYKPEDVGKPKARIVGSRLRKKIGELESQPTPPQSPSRRGSPERGRRESPRPATPPTPPLPLQPDASPSASSSQEAHAGRSPRNTNLQDTISADSPDCNALTHLSTLTRRPSGSYANLEEFELREYTFDSIQADGYDSDGADSVIRGDDITNFLSGGDKSGQQNTTSAGSTLAEHSKRLCTPSTQTSASNMAAVAHLDLVQAIADISEGRAISPTAVTWLFNIIAPPGWHIVEANSFGIDRPLQFSTVMPSTVHSILAPFSLAHDSWAFLILTRPNDLHPAYVSLYTGGGDDTPQLDMASLNLLPPQAFEEVTAENAQDVNVTRVDNIMAWPELVYRGMLEMHGISQRVLLSVNDSASLWRIALQVHGHKPGTALQIEDLPPPPRTLASRAVKTAAQKDLDTYITRQKAVQETLLHVDRAICCIRRDARSAVDPPLARWQTDMQAAFQLQARALEQESILAPLQLVISLALAELRQKLDVASREIDILRG